MVALIYPALEDELDFCRPQRESRDLQDGTAFFPFIKSSIVIVCKSLESLVK